MCQSWLRSDGRVEKRGGYRQTKKTAALYSRLAGCPACSGARVRGREGEGGRGREGGREGWDGGEEGREGRGRRGGMEGRDGGEGG